jgi:hypothetical protein
MNNSWLLALLFCIFPGVAHAHVKWFVEEDHAFTQATYQFDSLFAFIFAGAFIFITGAGFLQRKARSNLRAQQFLYVPISARWMANPAFYANNLLKFSLGIMLLANLLQGHFIAPNFVADGNAFHYALIQAALILLLIVDVSFFALALLVFSLTLPVFFPVEKAIDYAPELIALSLALLFTCPRFAERPLRLKMGLGANSVKHAYPWSYRTLAIVIVQLGLGIQLIILTFHDKLLHPGFGLAFLQEYPVFNFPQYFGWHSFTDTHFVFGAGLAELCFGLLLVTNMAPRLASLLIAFVFTLTGFVLGPEELLGHVPIIAMSLVLLLTPNAPVTLRAHALDAPLVLE